MQLVYAVVLDPSTYSITIVDQKPAGVRVFIQDKTWDNGYDGGKKRFGESAWWRHYRQGTVIGVYDLSDLSQVQSLAHLVANCQSRDQYDRMPSRESSH